MLAFSALPQGAQAQAALQDRITQPIETANRVPLAGTVHPLAKPEFDTGLVDNAKVLEGMTINFKRSAAQEASLQALLAAQQEPSSPSYHKWLTPAQFGQQYGMSAGDLAQVTAWLQQEGFTVTSSAQSSNAISFSGSVANVERSVPDANTQLHREWRNPLCQLDPDFDSRCPCRHGEQRSRTERLPVEAENGEEKIHLGPRRQPLSHPRGSCGYL